MFNLLNPETLERYYIEMVAKPASKLESPWILQRCMATIKKATSS